MKTKTPEQLASDCAKQKAYRATLEYKEWYRQYRQDSKTKERIKLWKRADKATVEGKYRAQLAAFKSALKSYGLTLDDWHRMIVEQSGRCACCNEPMINPNEPSIDHCHIGGKVRSLLCNNCNLGIGHFAESTQRLQQAIEYLQTHKG